MSPNPSKVLRLFAETQDRLYDGDTVRNALGQISKHTTDQKIIKTCQAIADILEISFDQVFKKHDVDQHFAAVKKLQNHIAWVNLKYKEVKECANTYNPKWINPLQQIMDVQLARLQQLISLLTVEPDICDVEGNLIRPNDLVVYPCQDKEGNAYEHYGVVRATPSGYKIAHFFTGETVRPEGRVVDVGIGYVYFSAYESSWLFKERPESVSDSQIETRINESREKIIHAKDELWNKLRYNCEHWAREMVYGEPRSIQVENLRTKKAHNGSSSKKGE